MQNKKNMQGMIRIVLFITLAVFLVVQVSYLMRPHLNFFVTSRALEQEQAPIDVLLIGGSSTFVFWSPMLAYQEYGISSFDYSDSAMAISLMKGLIEQSRSACTPKLYVIDIRAFENAERQPDVYTEGCFRIYSDVYPYSIKRHQLIHYASQFKNFQAQEKTLYWDLLYYHDQWRNKKKNDWVQTSDGIFKGQYMGASGFEPVELNAYTDCTARKPLSENTEKVLSDLMDYVEENNLPVLFLLNAYSFPDADMRATFNSVFDRLQERGMPCLDTNLYYQEMGLDGHTDYYNRDHVNAFGCEKYTKWLGKWLKEHYALADHRGEEAFEPWNQEAIQFNAAWDALKQHYTKLIKEAATPNE